MSADLGLRIVADGTNAGGAAAEAPRKSGGPPSPCMHTMYVDKPMNGHVCFKPSCEIRSA
jgi:hypothetical protein